MNNTTGISEKLMIPISIVVAGLIISAGIYLNGRVPKSSTNQPKNPEVKSENLKDALRPVDANDHILGNPEARVLLVQYSDTECPFCKMFHTTLLSIMKEYGETGNVAWIYRHYPIAELHSRAPKEAEAQECAGEIGGNSKFWEFTNKIFEITPSNNELDPKELTNVATSIGLSSQTFNTCLESGQYAPRVNIDIQNAEELGALGTPYTVLVDTKKGEYYPIEGAYPYAQLKQVIDIILSS